MDKKNETDDTTYSSEVDNTDNSLCKLYESNELKTINVNINVNMKHNNVNKTVVEQANDSHSDQLCGVSIYSADFASVQQSLQNKNQKF